MAFDAQKFRTSLSNDDNNPASPAYFEMRISRIPNVLAATGNIDYYQELAQKFTFRCSSVDLPSRQVETQERRYHGPQRLIPYGLIYSTLNMEILEDANFSAREFFDSWQTAIFGGDRFRVAYYDDCIADFELTAFTKSGRRIRGYIFHDAFPVSINPSQMAWSSVDQMLHVPVEIAYHYWESFVGEQFIPDENPIIKPLKFGQSVKKDEENSIAKFISDIKAPIGNFTNKWFSDS